MMLSNVMSFSYPSKHENYLCMSPTCRRHVGDTTQHIMSVDQEKSKNGTKLV